MKNLTKTVRHRFAPIPQFLQCEVHARRQEEINVTVANGRG
jgi:hypothetical protein